jgi:hypothetical protein
MVEKLATWGTSTKVEGTGKSGRLKQKEYTMPGNLDFLNK